MKYMKHVIGLYLLGWSQFVLAGPIDLSSWLIDGAGSWTLNTTVEPNDSATQNVNSIPTVLFNNMDSQGLALSGTIEVQTSADDDFIGFVLGYDDEDLFGSNASTDYILVDWKQGTQSGWDAGMSISRVTGGPIASNGVDTGSNAWQHTGHVNFIERAATLGNVGWQDFQEYAFDIQFTSTNIRVLIDGIEQFNINGSFENGSFGFYNFSQERVRYAGIEEDVVPTIGVSEPSILVLLALSLIYLARFKKFKH